MSGGALAFRRAPFRSSTAPGAARAATQRRDPMPGRRRQFPVHRGATGHGAGVNAPHNDDGVPLAAALAAVAEQGTPEERAALAAWWAISPAGRGWALAVDGYESGRNKAPWDAPDPGFPSRPFIDGKPCEDSASTMRAYRAALPAQEACAARLTDALRAGAWVLEYQPSDPTEPRKREVDLVWRFYRIAIRSDLAPIVKPTVTERQPPAWRRASGHVAGSVLFKPAGPMVAELQNERAAKALAVRCDAGEFRSGHQAAVQNISEFQTDAAEENRAAMFAKLINKHRVGAVGRSATPRRSK